MVANVPTAANDCDLLRSRGNSVTYTESENSNITFMLRMQVTSFGLMATSSTQSRRWRGASAPTRAGSGSRERSHRARNPALRQRQCGTRPRTL